MVSVCVYRIMYNFVNKQSELICDEAKDQMHIMHLAFGFITN